MRSILAVMFLVRSNFSTSNSSIFNPEEVIFKTSGNITKVLVQSVDNTFIYAKPYDMPTIFFTVTDPHFDGGTCIYVLEDLAAYEILEGGRDTTVDYGSDKNVYFGSKDGVYKYEKNSLSAKRFGDFQDDIIQIQKANGKDRIYYLTSDKNLFALESNGSVRIRVAAYNTICANQFVLDTSNNIYYVECKTDLIYILKASSTAPLMVSEDFTDVTLIRPAFIMKNCIPLLGDGALYILYINGTVQTKDFNIAERPSAFSVDLALYIIVAHEGKMYEYNVMEVLLKSMYGHGSTWYKDLSNIIMSVIGGSKTSLELDLIIK